VDRFSAFVKKEFLHIIRDKRSLLVLIAMPVAQILLFGFAITNEIKDASIAILDKSKDVTSQQLVNKILSSGYFKLDSYLNSESEIEQIFREGKVKLAFIIEDNFELKYLNDGRASVQIISDASDPNTGNTLINYLSAIVQNFNSELNETSSDLLNVSVEVTMRYNKNLKGAFLFVPGIIALILMLISAMMTSISITREKEHGNMELLLVSPVKPAQIIIAKVLPYSGLAFINAITILILGNSVFGVPINGSIILLLAVCILYIITSLSLGILISTKVNTQQVALMISLIGLMLPTIMLSGFIFPTENMPLPLQIISNIIPAKWFLLIIKDIMLKGVGFTYIWKEALVLVGFSAIFILLSIKNYKVRLQ